MIDLTGELLHTFKYVLRSTPRQSKNDDFINQPLSKNISHNSAQLSDQDASTNFKNDVPFKRRQTMNSKMLNFKKLSM